MNGFFGLQRKILAMVLMKIQNSDTSKRRFSTFSMVFVLTIIRDVFVLTIIRDALILTNTFASVI